MLYKENAGLFDRRFFILFEPVSERHPSFPGDKIVLIKLY